MTEDELKAIEARAKNYPAFAPDPYTTMWVRQVSQQDIPALIAEVRRLQEQAHRAYAFAATIADHRRSNL